MTPSTPQRYAVVLAAGAGSRFTGTGHKLHGIIDGRPVARHAIETAATAAIGPVLVVTGAADIDDIVDAVAAAHTHADISAAHNPSWASGQATSLAVAIEHARLAGVDSIVVGLADQPFIDADAWRRVARSMSPIGVATYDGRRGNPVRLARSVWPLMPRTGDAGARSVMRLRPDLVEEVPCVGSASDIDTLEDLRSWQNRSSTNSP